MKIFSYTVAPIYNPIAFAFQFWTRTTEKLYKASGKQMSSRSTFILVTRPSDYESGNSHYELLPELFLGD